MKILALLPGLALTAGLLFQPPLLAQLTNTTPGSGAGTLTQDNSATSGAINSTPGNGMAPNAPLGQTEFEAGSDGSSGWSGYDSYDSSGSYGEYGGYGGYGSSVFDGFEPVSPDIDLDLAAPDAAGIEQQGPGLHIFEDADDSDVAVASRNWTVPVLLAALAALLIGVIVIALRRRRSYSGY